MNGRQNPLLEEKVWYNLFFLIILKMIKTIVQTQLNLQNVY